MNNTQKLYRWLIFPVGIASISISYLSFAAPMCTTLDGLGACFFRYFPLYAVIALILLVCNTLLLALIQSKLRYIALVFMTLLVVCLIWLVYALAHL